jgi:hypothetical protein
MAGIKTAGILHAPYLIARTISFSLLIDSDEHSHHGPSEVVPSLFPLSGKRSPWLSNVLSISTDTPIYWVDSRQAPSYAAFIAGALNERLIGNLVRLQGCPAAVSENERRNRH